MRITGAQLRQALAVVALVFGVLTQSLAGIKLPPTASLIMGIFGTFLLAVQHYVADPSTGTPTPSVKVPPPGS